MKKLLSIVPRWFPAFLLMLIIFIFSSRASDELPNFHGWDYFIKKTAHAFGYGLLALAYLHGFNFNKKHWLAWLMAILYSATDEFHQAFVPGRHASLVDIFIFDNLGVILALYLDWHYGERDKVKVNHTSY